MSGPEASDAAPLEGLPQGVLQLLILQPTPFCNIDCDYCYLPERNSKARMSLEVLTAAMDRVRESGLAGEQLTVVWHAGEPLVLGVPWYREALDALDAHAPPGVTLTHSFQTNGMLLDDAWCDLIAERSLRVGVSIDGPAPLHDARRKTRSGKGTLAPALEGLARLRARGLDFHLISVLTRAALRFPDELFEFYLEHGVRQVGFNVEEIEGGHRASSLAALDVDRAYRAFFLRFFALLERAGAPLVVRELTSALEVLSAPSPAMRDQQNVPWAIVTVGVDGSFSTFSPELLGVRTERWGDFSLGDVRTRSFREAAASERFRALWAEIEEGVAACRASCAYFELCGGGAPANKYFETSSFASTETLFCRLSRRALYDVCAGYLRSEPRP